MDNVLIENIEAAPVPQPEVQDEIVICLENCYNISTTEDNEWQETGKTIAKRWIMPHAMVDLEEETHDNCTHYVVTIEFSDKHYDWNGQRLRFGTNKALALEESKKIVAKLVKWHQRTSHV